MGKRRPKGRRLGELTLGLVLYELDGTDPCAHPCPSCGEDSLSITQPDGFRPEVLLATCTGCDKWFLVDASAGKALQLPTVVELNSGNP